MWLAACHACAQLWALNGPPGRLPAIRAVDNGWETPLSYSQFMPRETVSTWWETTLPSGLLPLVSPDLMEPCSTWNGLMYRSTVFSPDDTSLTAPEAACPISDRKEPRPTSACQGLGVRRVGVQGHGSVLEAVGQRVREVVLRRGAQGHVHGYRRGVREERVHRPQAIRPLHHIAPLIDRTNWRIPADAPGWFAMCSNTGR